MPIKTTFLLIKEQKTNIFLPAKTAIFKNMLYQRFFIALLFSFAFVQIFPAPKKDPAPIPFIELKYLDQSEFANNLDLFFQAIKEFNKNLASEALDENAKKRIVVICELLKKLYLLKHKTQIEEGDRFPVNQLLNKFLISISKRVSEISENFCNINELFLDAQDYDEDEFAVVSTQRKVLPIEEKLHEVLVSCPIENKSFSADRQVKMVDLLNKFSQELLKCDESFLDVKIKTQYFFNVLRQASFTELLCVTFHTIFYSYPEQPFVTLSILNELIKALSQKLVGVEIIVYFVTKGLNEEKIYLYCMEKQIGKTDCLKLDASVDCLWIAFEKESECGINYSFDASAIKKIHLVLPEQSPFFTINDKHQKNIVSNAQEVVASERANTPANRDNEASLKVVAKPTEQKPAVKKARGKNQETANVVNSEKF